MIKTSKTKEKYVILPGTCKRKSTRGFATPVAEMLRNSHTVPNWLNLQTLLNFETKLPVIEKI